MFSDAMGGQDTSTLDVLAPKRTPGGLILPAENDSHSCVVNVNESDSTGRQPQQSGTEQTEQKDSGLAAEKRQSELLKVARGDFAECRTGHDGGEITEQPDEKALNNLGKRNSEGDSFLPIRPVTVHFKDITLVVTTKKPGILDHIVSLCKRRKLAPVKKKMILNMQGIEESFEPGDCVALMGCSGSGKSTLLNVLSCRVTSDVKGSIYMNEYKASPLVCKQLGGFVQQLDLFYAHLTVTEHLKYQARLRLSSRTTASQRRATYESMMKTMGLWKVKDSFIGDASTHGALSGGEQKRLAVATELLNQPSVIFADEPTSGLDSFMAKAVCDHLSQLAAANRTVVCTIHQPSSSCFELFNKVCIISEGRVMFCGPRLAAISWFEKRYKECPPFTNPAEFLLECVSVGNIEEAERVVVQKRLTIWAEEWKQNGKQFVKDWESGGFFIFRDATLNRFGEVASVVRSSFDSRENEITPHSPNKTSSISRLASTSSAHRSQKIGAVAADSGNAGDDSQSYNADYKGAEHEFEVNVFERFDIFKNPMKIQVVNRCKAPGAEYQMNGEPRLKLHQEFWVLVCRACKLLLRNKNVTWLRFIITIITALIPSFMYFQLSWNMSDAWNKVAASFQIILSQAMASMFFVAFTIPVDHPIAMRESESGVIRMWLYVLTRVQTDSIIWIIYPAIYHVICFWIMRLATTAIKWFVTLCITWMVVQCLLSYGYLVAAIVPDENAALAIVQVLQIILMLFSGLLVKLDQVGRFWVWVEAISPFKYGLQSFTYELFRGEYLDVDGQGPVAGEVFLATTFGIKDNLWLDAGIMLALIFGVRLIAVAWVFTFSGFIKENQ